MEREVDKAPHELTGAFARMAGLLLAEQSLEATLELLSSLAQETIPDTAGAAVTVVRDDKRFTAAGAELVEKADALQYEMNEGPCLTAWRERVVVRIDSMCTERRWPRWAAAAAAMGIESALSVPLVVRGQSLGAVKVCSRHPGSYDARHERILSTFSQQAAVVVSNLLAYTDARELADQLQEALETRDTIGMAKGILIAREGVDDEAAFDMLRQASQNANVKLRDVARELVRDAIQGPQTSTSPG